MRFQIYFSIFPLVGFIFWSERFASRCLALALLSPHITYLVQSEKDHENENA